VPDASQRSISESGVDAGHATTDGPSDATSDVAAEVRHDVAPDTPEDVAPDGQQDVTVDSADDAQDSSEPDASLGYPAPVAYYTFDEQDVAYHDLVDRAGTRSGDIFGTTVVASGQVAEAMRFDGDDDYVELDSFSDLSGGFTISMWVRVYSWPGTTANPGLFDAWGWTESKRRFAMAVGYESHYTVFVSRNGVEIITVKDSSVIKADEWTHVAATYDGSSVRLYRNAALVGFESAPGALYDDQLPVWLGRSHADGTPAQLQGSHFDGEMDELAVWVTALSEMEIGAVRQRGLDHLPVVP